MITKQFKYIEKLFPNLSDEQKEELQQHTLNLFGEMAKVLTWELEATEAENFYAIAFNATPSEGQQTHYHLTFQRTGQVDMVTRLGQLNDMVEELNATIARQTAIVVERDEKIKALQYELLDKVADIARRTERCPEGNSQGEGPTHREASVGDGYCLTSSHSVPLIHTRESSQQGLHIPAT